MGETKHTPGPWVAGRPDLDGLVEITSPHGPEEAMTACCWSEADAHLIAAAPELLAAARAVRAAVTALLPVNLEAVHVPPGVAIRLGSAFGSVLLAIAKAEGR